MRQLPLALSGRSASSFDDFVVGANDVAVAQLRALADAPAPVFVWGDPGCGKTHVMDALTRGGTRGWFGPAASAPWAFDPGWRWIVLDDVHRLDAAQQRDAFALLVEAQTFAVPWAAAAPVPPIDLPLRDDLRTRLGWGLVCALQPLDESLTRRVLGREAARRGIVFGDEVLDFLLHRFARDLGHLMHLLDRIDQFALAQARPVTLPLLRRMLAEAQAPGHEPSSSTCA